LLFQSKRTIMQVESFSIESKLGEFSKINYNGFGNVTLKHGDNPKIVVSSKFEIEKAIKHEIIDGTLRIRVKDSIGLGLKSLMRLESPDLKTQITYSSLDEIVFNGMGNLSNIGVLEGFDFRVINNGVGTVSLNVDVKTIYSKLDGAGTLELTGSAEEHSCNLNGAGKIEARKLEAETVTAVSRGIGSVSVFASKKLEAKLTGIGNITHFGNPNKVESKIQGI
jgi:hypothetical protein